MLVKMEAGGLLTLPPLLQVHSTRMKPIQHTSRSDTQEEIVLSAGALPHVHVEIAKTVDEKSLWNEYIDRYHYLGYTPLAGAQMKYCVYSEDTLLALLGFGACAWRIAPRDWYIEWSDEKREENLHLVLNNARFLILPWVYSKNLASMVLSMVTKRIGADWEKQYKYTPVLLETFVEKIRFSGTSYKAANWKFVGTTKGRGKKGTSKEARLPQKDIFMYPLQKDFRIMLC